MADSEIQPLSTLGQPLVSPNAPVVTPDAVKQLSDAFQQGFVTTNDILEHTGAVAMKKGMTAEQLLNETLAPDAVKARKEQMLFAGEKAQADRADLLAKDFIAAYRRYNLPLKKADGSLDYAGMAEVGQKYAEQERIKEYATIGLTGIPRESIENGRKVVRLYNALGDDITEVPGKKNAAREHFQKLLRNSQSYLLRNDDEPEVPKGKTAPQIHVSPEILKGGTAAAAPVVEPTPSPSQWKASLPPIPTGGVDPGQAKSWLFESGAMPAVQASRLTDQEALETFNSYQDKLEQIPKVSPASAAPVHISTGGQTITVAPAAPAAPVAPTIQPAGYSGEGVTTGFEAGTLTAPKEIVDNLRSQEAYKNWAEKTPAISRYKQIVASYANEKPGEVTTQKDLSLATTALLLSMPGGGGSRGMPEGRYRTIEEMQPIIEQVFHFVPKFLKKEAFTPETRQRIIEEANRSVIGLESSAASSVKNAIGLFGRSGVSPDEFLTEDERRLAASAGGVENRAGGVAREVTLSSGKKIRVAQ